MLMTHHYPGLGSASDWLEQVSHQRHYPDLSSDASSVWNFCASFTDVISRGSQWWCHEMWAVFSGSRNVSKIGLNKLVNQSMLQISFNPSQVKNWVNPLCSEKQLAYSSWFHLRFEHFDVISMVNKSADHRIFRSICKQNIRDFDKRWKHWS